MVSTQRQVDAGSSLEAQQRICEEWAKNNKHTVVAIFMDQGQSAKETSIKKRPQLLEMLEEAKGKSFDLLVIHKLDRLSRSLRDTLTLMSTLDTYGVKLVSVNEQYDFSTAIGKMTSGIPKKVALKVARVSVTSFPNVRLSMVKTAMLSP